MRFDGSKPFDLEHVAGMAEPASDGFDGIGCTACGHVLRIDVGMRAMPRAERGVAWMASAFLGLYVGGEVTLGPCAITC